MAIRFNPADPTPLSDDEIEDLRSRLTNELVDHYVRLANGDDDEETEKPARRGKPAPAKADGEAKDGDLLQ